MMKKFISALVVICIGAVATLGPASAAPPYQNTTPGGFGNAANPCTGTPFVRTISVTDNLTIADLDVGLAINHAWRLDIRATLTSPSGTSVQILNDAGNPQFVNYNVRLDDEAPVDVNTGTHGSDPASPQYVSEVRPSSSLTAFNGESALGNWTLSLCDVFGADDGTFLSAELFISTTPDPGDPIPLSCGASALRHDWNANPWPANSTTNTYTIGSDDLRVTIGGSTASLLNDPETGAATPVTSTYYTGGNGTTQQALFTLANFPNLASNITYTIDVGDLSGGVNPGVDELEFSFLDVDFGTGAFHDRITITGSHNGSSVTPLINTSAANSSTGNVATGTTAAGQDSAAGTVRVLFQDRVSSVTIIYDNGPLAPADPGNQGVALYDILVCPATNAVLEASKTNRIAGDLYALPGNEVIYTINVANIGTGPTDDDSIVLIDSMPSEVEFFRPAGSDSVTFAETGATGLDFTFADAVGFSNAATKPTTFGECVYDPLIGYDPNVTFICINPKDALAAGTGFSVEFRARIE